MIMVPSHDTMPSQFVQCLVLGIANLIGRGFQLDYSAVQGTYITEARRMLAQKLVESDAEYGWWIDADMTFPPDAGFRLFSRKLQIVGCNYRRRKYPIVNFLASNGVMGALTTIETNDDSPSLEKVDNIPGGMLMVHRSVYENMSLPHYANPYDAKLNSDISEDYYFCVKAKEKGISIYCDHDLSKSVAHVGTIEYTCRPQFK